MKMVENDMNIYKYMNIYKIEIEKKERKKDINRKWYL